MEEDRGDHEEHQRTGCGEHPYCTHGGLESLSFISETKRDYQDSEIKKSVIWDGVGKDIEEGAAECIEGPSVTGALWISTDGSKGKPGSSGER